MLGVLIDLDGVVYQNQQLIDGADKTIEWLQQQKIPHLFVTNTTSKPRCDIVAKLDHMGLNVSEGAILTPVVATQTFLKSLSEPTLGLFVVDATAQEFKSWRIAEESHEPVDVVILGDLGEQWDFKTMNTAFRMLMANPDSILVALGMTRYWRGAEGLQLDAGPFVQALSFATHREPHIMGKPDAKFFQAASKMLGVPVDQLLMVGDDAISDVEAAQKVGLKGALVKTGKYQQTDLQRVKPDLLMDSFADLPNLWPQLA